MKIGYKIIWSESALAELSQTFNYLETNWTKKELNRLANSLEKTISLISKAPNIYPKSNKGFDVRKCILLRYNSIYYRVDNQTIGQLLFFLFSPIGKVLVN